MYSKEGVLNSILFIRTKPKPVGHGYVFSMAVGQYYWGMVETGPFFVRGRSVDSEGGCRLAIFNKINSLAVKYLKINILAWVPRKKINNPASIRFKSAIS